MKIFNQHFTNKTLNQGTIHNKKNPLPKRIPTLNFLFFLILNLEQKLLQIKRNENEIKNQIVINHTNSIALFIIDKEQV